MDQKLEFIYFTTRSKSDYIDFHKHECYELVYYVTGSGVTQIDGKRHSYSAGCFSVMKPHSVHDETHSKDTEVIFIGFSCTNFTSLENGMFSDDYKQSIYSFLKQIKKEVAEQKKNFSLKVDLILGELLIEIDRMHGQNRKNANLNYVLGYIDEHFNQPADLKALAKLSGYSYHHFRHLFKQVTGLSPVNYILRKKLEGAAKLLEQTSLPVTMISQDCGFSNESQFCAMFKKYSGCTPGIYRKKHNIVKSET